MGESCTQVTTELFAEALSNLQWCRSREYYDPMDTEFCRALDICCGLLEEKIKSVGANYPKEYSDFFDLLRQHRVEMSMHKYGSAADNFGKGLVSAIGSHDLCIKKYQETGNTEYLCDAANYLMFEFMYPQVPGAFFSATAAHETAGIVGQCRNQLSHEDERFWYFLDKIAAGKM